MRRNAVAVTIRVTFNHRLPRLGDIRGDLFSVNSKFHVLLWPLFDWKSFFCAGGDSNGKNWDCLVYQKCGGLPLEIMAQMGM